MVDTLGLKGYRLAERIGISPSLLSALLSGKNKGSGHMFWEGIRREFPKWEPYLKGETETPPTEAKTTPYKQEEERMLAHPRGGRQRDMDAGSYGAPDLEGYTVVKVIEPGDAVYIRKVEEILRSNEPGAALALKSNIDQFHDKIQNHKQLQQQLDELVQEVRQLQSAIGELLDRDKPPEGTEERRKSFIHLKDKFFRIPGEGVKQGNGNPKT